MITKDVQKDLLSLIGDIEGNLVLGKKKEINNTIATLKWLLGADPTLLDPLPEGEKLKALQIKEKMIKSVYCLNVTKTLVPFNGLVSESTSIVLECKELSRALTTQSKYHSESLVEVRGLSILGIKDGDTLYYDGGLDSLNEVKVCKVTLNGDHIYEGDPCCGE